MTLPAEQPRPIFTIGHSNLEVGRFIALLSRHEIEVIADVRSKPYSRFNPQFNRDVLDAALRQAGIRYRFMGSELGARRDEPDCYVDDQARYDLVAKSTSFQRGLDRVRNGAQAHRIALMCAEKDPITCHRSILIGRRLRETLDVAHIMEDGSLESLPQSEDRLLSLLGLPAASLFQSKADLVEQAYDQQGGRIAYRRSELMDAVASEPIG